MGSVFPFGETFIPLLEDIRFQRNIVERLSTQIQAAFQIDLTLDLSTKLTELSETLKELENPFRHVEDLTEHTNNIVRSSEVDKVLDWISIVPQQKHHAEVYGTVLHGTGKWLMCSKELQKWHDASSSEIMWLHGIPGSDKSRLVFVQCRMQLSVLFNTVSDPFSFRK